MKTLEAYQEGKVLLIDKPLNWTSFQVVNKIRWLIKQQFEIKKIKVGHAGTLDPLATGLLIICTGKQTKEIHVYQGQEKEYTGTITIGATTPSYDLETEIDKTIHNLLEEYVKPAVESDGGAIDFKSFDEGTGVVTVVLRGSCSGCPSSTATLKGGIESLLKAQLPQVKEVVALEG